jgi:hypothetical protein
VLLELLQIGYRQAPRLLFVIAVLSVVGAALEAVGFVFLAPLMAVLTGAPLTSMRWPLGSIAAQFASAGPRHAVLFFAAIFGTLMTLRFAAIAANLSLIAELEVRTVRYLRLRCLAVLFFAPQPFIDSYDNARIVQHFNEQSMRAGESLRVALRTGTNAATFGFSLAVLFVLSVSLVASR